jgi:hypothetical protein
VPSCVASCSRKTYTQKRLSINNHDLKGALCNSCFHRFLPAGSGLAAAQSDCLSLSLSLYYCSAADVAFSEQSVCHRAMQKKRGDSIQGRSEKQ